MNLQVTVLEISGILDGTRGNLLRREVSEIVAKGSKILLIDLKNVNFIDSSGLGALVSAMQTVKNADAKLFLCSVSDQARMLFELTKLDKIFPIFANQDEFNEQVLAVQKVQ